MTRLATMTPMLICDDVQESIRFYCDALGFEVVDRMDDVGKSGWAALRHGEIKIMLASPHHEPEPVKVDGKYPQAVYYFYPDDVVVLRESLVTRGLEATELRVTFYGMKEFGLNDPSGHTLLFGQDTDEPVTVVEE